MYIFNKPKCNLAKTLADMWHGHQVHCLIEKMNQIILEALKPTCRKVHHILTGQKTDLYWQLISSDWRKNLEGKKVKTQTFFVTKVDFLIIS